MKFLGFFLAAFLVASMSSALAERIDLRPGQSITLEGTTVSCSMRSGGGTCNMFGCSENGECNSYGCP